MILAPGEWSAGMNGVPDVQVRPETPEWYANIESSG